MKTDLNDIDGKIYYTKDIDPHAVFNKLEITLSHLFREKMAVLGNRTYSDCVFEFLKRRGYSRPAVVEVGCGLGDIALNVLAAGNRKRFGIEKYVMVDISPELLRVQRERLGDLVSDYLLGDCLELSSFLKPFDGMLVSNAVIADLRAILIQRGQSLSEYGIDDVELSQFAAEWTAARGPCYVHVGALQFLHQVRRVLKVGGTAAILEYAATDMNQPSLFYDEDTGGVHTKCGIDFAQVQAYATRLGLQAEVVPIEEIWGIRREEEFLTVDVWVRPEKILRELPNNGHLQKLIERLPVRAYTRPSLRDQLTADLMGFSPSEADALVKSLNDYFHSVHDPRFDSTNPTTWGYQCLLLRSE